MTSGKTTARGRAHNSSLAHHERPSYAGGRESQTTQGLYPERKLFRGEFAAGRRRGLRLYPPRWSLREATHQNRRESLFGKPQGPRRRIRQVNKPIIMERPPVIHPQPQAQAIIQIRSLTIVGKGKDLWAALRAYIS